MKYRVTEWYEDCMNPSGENDRVIRSEVIEANSEFAAEEQYERKNHVGHNNVLKTQPES